MRTVWLALLLGAGLILPGCQSRSMPEPPPPPAPVFGDLGAVILDAGVVEVARRYQDRLADSSGSLLNPERLQLLAEVYAAERFQPWGGARTFKIVVRRAEISENPQGYSALMDIDLQMLDANRIVEGYDISSSSASVSLPDSATLEEREAGLDRLAEALLRSLDVKIQERLDDVFIAYVLERRQAAAQ
ncbi:MAG: hypothetical protein WEA84_14900 [Rhodovibrionaceae bacterium]